MKAFPSTEPIYGDNIVGVKQSTGMDLRDYFAAQATEQDIQPFLWKSVGSYSAVQCCTREEARYKYADAMMKAREIK